MCLIKKKNHGIRKAKYKGHKDFLGHPVPSYLEYYLKRCLSGNYYHSFNIKMCWKLRQTIIWNFSLTWTRSGLLQDKLVPFGGGGGGGQSLWFCFTNKESISGGPSTFGPYSSSSSVLLHFDIDELQDTDRTADMSSISPGTI